MATNTESSGSIPTCRRVATGHALAAPGANTSFLSATVTADGTTGLQPSARACMYRIQISLATGSVLNLYLTDGTTAYTIALNGGTALTAGVLYAWSILASRTKEDGTTPLTYQLRVATDSVIQTLIIDEVIGAVS